MQTSNGQRDPFRDGPELEENSLSRIHLMIHCAAVFFTFLATCTIGAVAGFQAKWLATSGGTGFTIFLDIAALLLSVVLIVIPEVYDRWDKMKKAAKFLSFARSRLILHAFGTFLTILSAFIVTISAWTAKGCKDPANDPHASLGEEFQNGLKQWCTTKKASGFFNWFSFAAWAALLVLVGLEFRRERKHEPAFIPPDHGISSSNVHERLPIRADEESQDPYADKHEVYEGYVDGRTGYESGGYQRTGTGIPERAEENGAFGRPSLDAYGSFDGDMPGNRASAVGGDEASRTMQLAYTDPYAHIKQSLMATAPAPMYSSQQSTQQYSQVLPNPPQYGGGYR